MIKLLPLEHAHYKMIFKLVDDNRAFFKKYLGWVDKVKTETDSMFFVEQTLFLIEKNKNINYMISWQEKLVGIIELREIENSQGIIGFWLDEKQSGKGIMSNAIKIFIHECKSKGIKRIILRAQTNNIASNRVALKNGFLFKKMEVNGETLYVRINRVVYSYLRKYCNEHA